MNYQTIRWFILLGWFTAMCICCYTVAFTSNNGNAGFFGFVFEFLLAVFILAGAKKPDPNHVSFFGELKDVINK